MYIATQDKPFFPKDFNSKFAMVRDMGFDAFEIDGKVLREQRGEIEKAVSTEKLPVRMICGGYTGWIGDFSEEKRRVCLVDIGEILKISGDLGISGIVVPAAWGMFSLRLPPMVPPGVLRKTGRSCWIPCRSWIKGPVKQGPLFFWSL
jgi:sugar phosphate isomerase/epimerase